MPKSYEICLRLSAEEKERLEHSARTCGLSKTAYLRRLILGKEVKALPSQEIKALRTEVHKIGVNINQIARSVNAGIAKAEDARRGLYLLEQVYELMYEVAKKEGPSPRAWPGRAAWTWASAMCSTGIRPRSRSLQPVSTVTLAMSAGRCWRPSGPWARRAAYSITTSFSPFSPERSPRSWRWRSRGSLRRSTCPATRRSSASM